MPLSPHLDRRVIALSLNRSAGASRLLLDAIGILRDALAAGEAADAAPAVCQAQPSMAPIWNAALHALAEERSPGRFDVFAQRVERAPAALARFAATTLGSPGGSGPRRLVTLSASRSVRLVLEALDDRAALTVACSEGRPALEGRTLAGDLDDLGIQVVYFTDAAIAEALDGADAVLVGADAVGPHAFLNKVGTRMLAAAASQHGVPVYVIASRDKFVMPALWPLLEIREGPTEEVWPDHPSRITVRNPYFEPTPLDAITSIVSDVGVLGGGLAGDVCAALEDEPMLAALAELRRHLGPL